MIGQWEEFTDVSLLQHTQCTHVMMRIRLQNLKKQINEKIDRETNGGVPPKVEAEEEPSAKRLKEEDGMYFYYYMAWHVTYCLCTRVYVRIYVYGCLQHNYGQI